MLSEECYAVIMAGGGGTRLWPLSSRDKPKHFLKLFRGRSLIELTVDRLRGLVPEDRILIMTNVKYRATAGRTLPQIPPENFICEPCLRDTASALGLAATVLRTRCATATMIVQTADQLIEPVDQFCATVSNAVKFLESHQDQLVAFGIEAAGPNTQVGWQKLGQRVDFAGCEVRQIVAFTEKPLLEIAQQYASDGAFCWNSGQFAWKVETILKEIDRHLPEATPLLAEIGEAWRTAERDQVVNELFPRMPNGSIDYKVMQKTNHACSIFLPCRWEDMGTHATLAGRIGQRRETNVVEGKAVVQGVDNIILATTDQHVVVAADNLQVVVTDNAVFVADRTTDMKALVEQIAREAPEIV